MTDPTRSAIAWIQRAEEREALGECAAAEAGFARSAAGFELAEGLLSPDAANALNRLAALREARGAYASALEAAEHADAIMRAVGAQLTDEDATGIRLVTARLRGHLYERLARYPAAEATLTEALALAETTLGPAHPEAALTRNALGIVYKYTGRFEAAEQLYLNNLGVIQRALGRPADARACFQRALEIAVTAHGPEHAQSELARANLASC